MMNVFGNHPLPTTIAIAALLCCVLASGLALYFGGRPISTTIFAIHKIATVTAALLFFTLVRSSVGLTSPSSLAAAVSLGVLLVSGGLLSLDMLPQGIMRFLHILGAAAGTLSTTASLWLIFNTQ